MWKSYDRHPLLLGLGERMSATAPITSCHNVRAIIVGDETMHYECPICHESVKTDGSKPSMSADDE